MWDSGSNVYMRYVMSRETIQIGVRRHLGICILTPNDTVQFIPNINDRTIIADLWLKDVADLS